MLQPAIACYRNFHLLQYIDVNSSCHGDGNWRFVHLHIITPTWNNHRVQKKTSSKGSVPCTTSRYGNVADSLTPQWDAFSSHQTEQNVQCTALLLFSTTHLNLFYSNLGALAKHYFALFRGILRRFSSSAKGCCCWTVFTTECSPAQCGWLLRTIKSSVPWNLSWIFPDWTLAVLVCHPMLVGSLVHQWVTDRLSVHRLCTKTTGGLSYWTWIFLGCLIGMSRIVDTPMSPCHYTMGNVTP